jgi:hypothetical protein
MMKKILVITYFFNQKDAIASVRMRGLVKFLPEFGWEATVLTVRCNITGCMDEKNDLTVIETDYDNPLSVWKKRLGLNAEKGVKEQFNLPTYKTRKTLIDACLHIWGEIFTYPDEAIGWYKSAIDAGTSLLEKEQFDIIFSSSGPATSHIIASHLSKRFNIPWIADFRDLWTQYHYYSYSKIRKVRERRLEIRTISSAKALTTVSQPLADKLLTIHKAKDVYCIPNGFDPDIVNAGFEVSKKFTICYTGFIYAGRQDPKILFEAISRLLEEAKIDRREIMIDFYGFDEGWLKYDIDHYGLADIVNIHGMVPRDVVLQKQRESQILLLLTWNDPREKGIYTGKVFDYLAAKRPILALGLNGGIVSDLIKQTNTGFFASSIEEIKEILIKWYLEYKLCGIIKYCGVESEVNKYNQREMVRKFAEVFDKNTN